MKKMTISLGGMATLIGVVVAWQALDWPMPASSAALTEVSDKSDQGDKILHVRVDNLNLLVLYDKLDALRYEIQQAVAVGNTELADEKRRREREYLRRIDELEK